MKKLILIGFFILGFNLYCVGLNLGVGGGYGKYLDNNTGSLNLNLEVVHEIFSNIELGFGGISEFNLKNNEFESFPIYFSGKFYSEKFSGVYVSGRYGRTIYKESSKSGGYTYLGVGKKLDSGLSIEGGVSVGNQDTKESTLDNGNISFLLMTPIF